MEAQKENAGDARQVGRTLYAPQRYETRLVSNGRTTNTGRGRLATVSSTFIATSSRVYSLEIVLIVLVDLAEGYFLRQWSVARFLDEGATPLRDDTHRSIIKKARVLDQKEVR